MAYRRRPGICSMKSVKVMKVLSVKALALMSRRLRLQVAQHEEAQRAGQVALLVLEPGLVDLADERAEGRLLLERNALDLGPERVLQGHRRLVSSKDDRPLDDRRLH